MKSSFAPPRSDPPLIERSVTVSELSDPTSVGEGIEVLSQDAVQLESKPLRALRTIVRLGECIVVFHYTNLPVRTRTRLLDSFVAYSTFGPGACGSINGIPIAMDRVSAVPGGTEVEFVVGSGYESVAFLIRPEFFCFHAEARQRNADLQVPSSPQVLAPDPIAIRNLYSWGRSLTQIAARQPELFDLPETQTSAKVELIELLFSMLLSVVPRQATKHQLTRERYSAIVQAAEDYVLSHSSGQLYITDLCKTTEVSERTLQYAFHEVMGMTPIAYLTKLRLHRVRQSLKEANHASTTVSNEATRWGFWHFGDFTRAYKDCFGELPSDTLKSNASEG